MKPIKLHGSSASQPLGIIFLVTPFQLQGCRAETESDGTRKCTGGEVKGKKANGGGSQHSRALYRTRSIQHYYR